MKKYYYIDITKANNGYTVTCHPHIEDDESQGDELRMIFTDWKDVVKFLEEVD